MPKFVVDSSEVLDVDEAAKQLGKGVATIWRWIKSNKIVTVRLSGRTLIPKSEIARLQEEI